MSYGGPSGKMKILDLKYLGINHAQYQGHRVDIEIPVFENTTNVQLLDEVIDYLESEEVWHYYEERPLNEAEVEFLRTKVEAWQVNEPLNRIHGGEDYYAYFLIVYGE